MSDAFVPEADRLEQEAEVPVPNPAGDEPEPAVDPDLILPLEASEADALDQRREVEGDEEDDFRDAGEAGYPEVSGE